MSKCQKFVKVVNFYSNEVKSEWNSFDISQNIDVDVIELTAIILKYMYLYRNCDTGRFSAPYIKDSKGTIHHGFKDR